MVLLPLPLLAALVLQANAPLDTARVDFATLPDTVAKGASVAPAASVPANRTAAVTSAIPTTRRLYLHPIFTAVSILGGDVVYLPVTYEQSLRPGRSFAIQPMVVFGSIPASDDNPTIDIFQVSAISQLRFYVNGEVPKRFYVAPALALGYMNLETDGNWRYTSGYLRGLIVGGAVYLGWTFDEGVVPCDLNIGLGGQSVLGESRNVRGYQGVKPLLDLNLGFGFRL